MFADGDELDPATLMVSDRRGRKAGCGPIGTRWKCVTDLPGATLEPLKAGGVKFWAERVLPVMELPLGRRLTATYTGHGLTEPEPQRLTVTGPGSEPGGEALSAAAP